MSLPDAQEPPAVKKRGRGRPRSGSSDARSEILGAAVVEFGDHGYDGTSMRGIAARAKVNSALVHHYFGTKAELFATALGFPARPDLELPRLLAGPREGLGARLLRFILGIWEKPEVQRGGILLLRSALGNRKVTPLLAGFLSREMLPHLVQAVGDRADAELRADAVASQIIGVLLARHILHLEPLRSASLDEVAELVGPTIDRYLFEE